MAIGSTVIFKGEKYKVIWLYDNGTCEIKKNDSLGQVELVRLSQLKTFEKTISSY
ncbi:hypothetical protein [Metabacillus rhizolycopersici]|uniref:Cyclic nucleotide-binding domain-containing protein n=1 Tax=Metabacillus rhizolycopersici TaxID=2875709 RepID=A0ABS7UTI5_9BACI|nr:hypothetical protein [Metabacillus rhizolycopersici]MBZ5751323.1 hypothetical protein [Metabacillus rhizolycopersici]